MSTFLAKWVNIEQKRHSKPGPAPLEAVQAYSPAASPGGCELAHVSVASEGAEHERAVSRAEWKAAALNQLFQEQGVTGQPGRITAATVLHGEADRVRVDSAATNEQPMSRAEAPAH